MDGVAKAGVVHDCNGNTFDIFNLGDAKVTIEQIAHALGNICRWGGRCSRFYSVAHHSVWVSEYLRVVLGGSPRTALHGLLHDIVEAYICDVPRPIKAMVRLEGKTLYEIEDTGAWDLLGALKIEQPSSAESAFVHAADNMALAIEADELMGGLELPGLPPRSTWPKRLPLRKDVWPAGTFLRRFKMLTAMMK